MGSRLPVVVLLVVMVAAAVGWSCWPNLAPAPSAPGPAVAVAPAAAAGPPVAAASLPRAPGEPAAPPGARLGHVTEPTGRESTFAFEGQPAGVVKVRVLRGLEPIAGARVRLWPPSGPRGDDGLVAGPPWRDGSTDAAGEVVFHQVALDEVLVRADDAAHWLVTTARVGCTAVVVFGAAGVRGTVRDERGVPLAGVDVALAGIGPLPPRGCRVRTTADGAFAFAALPAGRYHVQLDGTALPPAARDRMLTLATGEHAQMHFGGVPPPARLLGRVVDGVGDAVPGVRRVFCREVAIDDERVAITTPDGGFLVALPAGRWRLHAAEDDGVALAEVVVPDTPAEVAVTVCWPGIRFVCRLAGPAADEVPWADFQLLGAPGAVPFDHGFVVDGVRCGQWLGVPAGTVTLRLANAVQFASAPHRERAFDVPATQPVVTVAVDVAR